MQYFIFTQFLYKHFQSDDKNFTNVQKFPPVKDFCQIQFGFFCDKSKMFMNIIDYFINNNTKFVKASLNNLKVDDKILS